MSYKLITRIKDGSVLYDHVIMDDPMEINFASHTHDMWEILMLVRGDISYIVEGKSYKLQRDDIVLSRSSVFHSVRPESNATYERYNVIYDEKSLPRGIVEKIPRGVDIFRLANSEAVREIFEKIDAYSKRFSDEELCHITKNLIEEIFYHLAISDGAAESASVNPHVSSALRYIKENLTTVRSIEQICDALYITKSHLHHLFIKNIRMSPKQYINSKRLQRARSLIRKGRRPTEVFTECGFDDYATFFRNYKKHYGYPPSLERTGITDDEIKS